MNKFKTSITEDAAVVTLLTAVCALSVASVSLEVSTLPSLETSASVICSELRLFTRFTEPSIKPLEKSE